MSIFKLLKLDSNRLNPLLFLGLTALAAWLLLVATYSLRSDFRLGVGELGDGPYVTGFLGDEIGQAPARVRWTGSTKPLPDNLAVGVVEVPLSLNPAVTNAVRLNIRGAQNPPVFEVFVNKVKVGESRAENGTFKTVEFAIPAGTVPQTESTLVEIKSKTFQPQGDSRYLGVQVSEVKLLTTPLFRRPPLEALLAAWLYCAALGLLLLRLVGGERVIWAALAGSAGLIPWLLLPLIVPSGLNLWYTPFYLAGLGGLAAIVTLLAWRDTVSNGLSRFLEQLEHSPRLARNILWAGILVYSLYALGIIVQMDYIGHADYADNAVAARNIVQGKGYSLDYAAQFYEKYNLPRAADTWPPLQPFLIVPFYLVFGVSTWAAKLPNLLLAIALAWAIFHYGSRLFNRRTALAAALLTMVAVIPAFSTSPAFFESIAYPINDLPFTLLAFLNFCFWLLDFKLKKPEPVPAAGIVEVNEGEPGGAEIQPASTPAPVPSGRFRALVTNFYNPVSPLHDWLQIAIAGLLAGLLFLSKPSGGILLVGLGLWLLWRKYLAPNKIWLPWRTILLWAGATLLVISPYIVRNLLHFKSFYRSTEQWDAWITKWNPPDENIYNLFKPFSNQELPGPRQLLEFGWDSNLNAIANQFRKFFGHLTAGELLSPLLMALVVLGLLVLPRRPLRLFSLIGGTFLLYWLAFSVLWHYEPRYYLVWLPWAYLFGMYGLIWLYDKISASDPMEPGKSRRKTGSWLVVTIFLIIGVPGVAALLEDGPLYTRPTGMVIAADWLKQNTPANAVVMSRNVWELSFHSNRKSVMTPNNASLNQVKDIMRTYGARYVQLDHLNLDDRNINRQWGMRRVFWNMLDRKPDENFKLIYDQHNYLIYEWNGK